MTGIIIQRMCREDSAEIQKPLSLTRAFCWLRSHGVISGSRHFGSLMIFLVILHIGGYLYYNFLCCSKLRSFDYTDCYFIAKLKPNCPNFIKQQWFVSQISEFCLVILLCKPIKTQMILRKIPFESQFFYISRCLPHPIAGLHYPQSHYNNST